MSADAQALLAPDEPPPFTVLRPEGRSPFLLICDHASRRIPRRLGTLGVENAELSRHIAWDIGAAAVAAQLSRLLDATAVLQSYSRLVIDCNRPPGSPSSIVSVSERTPIPGNLHLTPAAMEQRRREIFEPYHARIAAELEARLAAGVEPVLISVHSFTPVFLDATRLWQMGLLYNRDARLAHALLEVLRRREPALIVGDNEPYRASDLTDYAIPVHGERRGLLHVGIEIRQDLIADEAGAAAWAHRLATALADACTACAREQTIRT